MKDLNVTIISGVSKKASKRPWTALKVQTGSFSKLIFLSELEKQYLLDQGVKEEEK